VGVGVGILADFVLDGAADEIGGGVGGLDDNRTKGKKRNE
jgi:hypothetical protein